MHHLVLLPLHRLITPFPGVGADPWFRYCATLNPAAIPVMEGCGIAGLLRAIFFLLLGLLRRGEDLLVVFRLRDLVDRRVNEVR